MAAFYLGKHLAVHTVMAIMIANIAATRYDDSDRGIAFMRVALMCMELVRFWLHVLLDEEASLPEEPSQIIDSNVVRYYMVEAWRDVTLRAH